MLSGSGYPCRITSRAPWALDDKSEAEEKDDYQFKKIKILKTQTHIFGRDELKAVCGMHIMQLGVTKGEHSKYREVIRCNETPMEWWAVRG